MRGALSAVLCLVALLRAIPARGAEPSDPRLIEANALNERVLQLYTAGQYALAVPQALRSLKLLEEVLPSTHADIVQSLWNLAQLYEAMGVYPQAEPLLLRVLQRNEAVLGPRHPDVAIALNNLGMLYVSMGAYAKAEPLYLRALRIREEGPDPQHPDVVTFLNNLAALYVATAMYQKAEPLLLRTLQLRERLLGPQHPGLGVTLSNLAELYQSMGMYQKAEPLLLRALQVQEVLGPRHPDVTMSLNNLAGLYKAMGAYAKAEPLYLRALQTREVVLGPQHHDVATSLNNLASLYRFMGAYQKAEPLFLRALKIWETQWGAEHPVVATALNNLALLYTAMGEPRRAEPLYQRALKIREQVLGPRHPDVAATLNNLAALYGSMGAYAKAEPLYLRALKLQEEALGPRHPDVATSLNNLAGLQESMGAYAKAEPLYLRALKIREELLGPRHPDVATSLNNAAGLLRSRGDYQRAEPLALRAVQVGAQGLGPQHPLLAVYLANLAGVYVAQGKPQRALPLFRRALAISEHALRQFLTEGSLGSYMGQFRGIEEAVYTLAVAHPADAEIQRLALATALLDKGRPAEQGARSAGAILRSLKKPAQQELFQRLRVLRTQISVLYHSPPVSVPEYQEALRRAEEQAAELEKRLASTSERFRAQQVPAPDDIVGAVARALPREAVLVELLAYAPFAFAACNQEERWGQERYLALVLLPDQRIAVKDLGPKEAIDAAARRLLGLLQRTQAGYREAALALYQQVMEPLVPLLGGRTQVFLSPDDELNLVPFAALYDGRRFLLDTYQLTYVTSGRDLLRRSPRRAGALRVVVLADPAFAPGVPRLPGTAAEARELQRLWPEARVLLQEQATKEALLAVAAPGVLHVATHGEFLRDVPAAPLAPPGGRSAIPLVFGALGPAAAPQAGPGPMSRAALLLAGSGAQGRATALELAGADLDGTRLVVLSACSTGTGEVRVGQGVYGLRRALFIAGAETLITSLWQVADQSTAELMGQYYRNLLAGQGRAEAMRQAARALHETHEHPYYWAPFIVIGDPGPLPAPAAP